MSQAYGGAAATDPSRRLAHGALAAGVLAAVLFFGVAFAFGGVWWLVAALAGADAVVLAATALRRGDPGRRAALAGAALGGIVVAWFLAYVVVAAVAG